MSVTATRTLAGVAASATAAVAAGFLSVPVAHAASCTVNGDYLRLQQHEGPYTTTTSVTAKGSTLGPGVVTVPPSGTNGTYGSASGSIDGSNITVHITWNDNKGTADFTGTIGNDGIAHGTSTGTPIPINLWNPGPWDTAPGLLNCTDDQGPAAAQQTATVNADTDLYNKPNDNGDAQVIGTLKNGQVVKVAGACSPNAWCILTDPKGAAWGRDLTNN
jgi:hypothetical protein